MSNKKSIETLGELWSSKYVWLFLLLAFLAGLAIGCSATVRTELKTRPTTYPQDLIYPVTEYDLDKVVTLEIKCCEDCGFAPWTDSWCEFHFGT
jgi:hypothetical protein